MSEIIAQGPVDANVSRDCQKDTEMCSGIQVEPGATSHINWKHIDGPMFSGKDGSIHWLTLWERLLFRCGLMTKEDLERQYNHNDQQG